MDKKKKQKLSLFAIITAFLLGIVILFGFQNAGKADVHFLVWTAKSHIGLLVIASFLLGAIAILAVGVPARIRRGAELKVYKKQVARLERSLQEEIIKNKELSQRKEVEEILSANVTPPTSLPESKEQL